MAIQWFPGHMMKAMRMMQENVNLVDCIVYVLDARVPEACINPGFTEIIGDKPIVYLLNKSDLANPAETTRWVARLTTEQSKAVALTATSNRAMKEVVEAISTLCTYRKEKWAQKGLGYTPRAMVVGIPNTGKSTVINMLCGKAKTITGNKPGVTRGKQWVRVDGVVDMLDTPGTLPKKFDDERAGRHLAYIGSVKDEITDIADLCFYLVDELTVCAEGALKQRYGVEESDGALAVMERIAVARGYRVRGGDYDYDRTAQAILDDFRKGRLGRITLEKA